MAGISHSAWRRMKCLRCLLRRGETPAAIEEQVRFWVRDEIAMRERDLSKKIETHGLARLLGWGSPPPPLDPGEPR